ncbi:hypothetical protein RBSWK_04471 [Rhodopirellula baltica SWK14]|uniref:Uncharacterized protein n=1 Tax=Rhodopirellula baltica SWK14 TaxID=993516 RepID=L7CCK7_RHOBT|nr:hypothetical protein RBSWK_04471 [Rhodopirellula baltica SWK14]
MHFFDSDKDTCRTLKNFVPAKTKRFAGHLQSQMRFSTLGASFGLKLSLVTLRPDLGKVAAHFDRFTIGLTLGQRGKLGDVSETKKLVFFAINGGLSELSMRSHALISTAHEVCRNSVL